MNTIKLNFVSALIATQHFSLKERNLDQRKKSVSALIATILLIVVAVALVAILLTWGKSFTNTSLSETTNQFKKADESIFFIKPMQFVNGTLVLKNISPSEEDINIIGYKIISGLSHSLLNNMITIESTIISKGDQQAIYIPFPPEKVFDMQLYTSNGYYLDVKNVTATSSPPIFTKVFGGEDYDSLEYPHLMIQTSDGGYLISGYTASYGSGGSDIWLIKLKQDGTLDWNQTFGGAVGESPMAVIETSDNKYLVLGATTSYGTGNGDIWLLKINPDGTLDWNQTYGLDGISVSPTAVIETSDNKYLVSGIASGNIYLVMANFDGTLDWNNSFGGGSDDFSTSLIETSDNKFLVSGVTASYGAGNYDIWLLKINSDGTLDWNQTFGGTANETPVSAIESSDNKYLVSGSTSSYGAGSYDIWLLKINLDGTLDWNQTFGGVIDEDPKSLIETNDNKYLILADTSSYGAGNNDIWLLKINQDGTLDWNKTFGGSGTEVAKSDIETTNGYLVIGTNTYVYNLDYDYGNYYIIKTDFNGNTLSEKTIGGPGTEYLYSVYKTADGGALIGGETSSYGGVVPDSCDWEIFIVKVDSSGSVPLTTDLPDSLYWQGCEI